jgi:hypothetical protein
MLLELRPAKVDLNGEDAQQLEKILNKCADELEIMREKSSNERINEFLKQYMGVYLREDIMKMMCMCVVCYSVLISRYSFVSAVVYSFSEISG